MVNSDDAKAIQRMIMGAKIVRCNVDEYFYEIWFAIISKHISNCKLRSSSDFRMPNCISDEGGCVSNFLIHKNALEGLVGKEVCSITLSEDGLCFVFSDGSIFEIKRDDQVGEVGDIEAYSSDGDGLTIEGMWAI